MANPDRPTPDDLRRPGDPSPQVNPTEARGGAPANRVRWVLIVGIPLVIIGFILAYVGSTP